MKEGKLRMIKMMRITIVLIAIEGGGGGEEGLGR